ncbi:MAG TPA: LptA/OstA family protein [Alphaproteobacteria bacterium]
MTVPSRSVLTFLAVMLLSGAGAQAQSNPLGGSNSKEPVEITANDAIEWLRNDHVYRARGAAQAKQGDMTINADLLEASYDPAVGEQDIQTIAAIGHVKIISADRTVIADKGIYDLKSGLLTLTGSDIRLSTADMQVTAEDKVIYDSHERKASAIGNAVIITQGRTLKAQQIDAWFSQDKTSNDNKNATGNLERARASGNVLIKTEKEILQANSADYNAVTQEAVVTGNVRLTQGENHLQGERAVVNMKTGISQLFGNANPNVTTGSSGGRVKALFFPGSKNEKIVPSDATGSMIPMRPKQKTGTVKENKS